MSTGISPSFGRASPSGGRPLRAIVVHAVTVDGYVERSDIEKTELSQELRARLLPE
jgi:hypothetical protein